MTQRQYLQVNYFCNYLLSLDHFKRALFILFLLCALGIPKDSFAQQFDLNINNVAPIKLVNSGVNTCGSGFLIGNNIVTNYHVAQTICSENPCSGIKIYSAKAPIELDKSVTINLIAAAPALDLALLKIENISNEKLLEFLPVKNFINTDNRNKLESFSFPNCSDLARHSGEELSKIADLYTETTLQLNHGSSGAAIFDANGKLFGIVSESSSLIEGIKSLIIGTSFESTRAIPAERLYELLNQDTNSVLELEIKYLLDFYLKNVISQTGIKRIEEGSRFLSKVKALALHEISRDNRATALLLAVDNYPSALFIQNILGIEKLDELSAQLALAASLEQSGLRSSFSQKLNKQQIENLIAFLENQYPNSKTIFKELITSVDGSDYPGSTLYFIKLALPGLVFLMGSMVLWLLGLGAILFRPMMTFRKKALFLSLWIAQYLVLVTVVLSRLYSI